MRLVQAMACCALIGPGLASRATAADVPETTLSLDLSKTRAPISKYVYGQFIEHLGRCIYGGLWAEMLEDRKFYYPVDGEAPAWAMFQPGLRSFDGEGHPYELLVRSPWMILGDKHAVSMTKDNRGRASTLQSSSPTAKVLD